MSDSLSPGMRERLQKLCKQITVSNEIDPEIQEELLGYMEDKLIAYLRGAEAVSEEDAFILTREHFGDPAVVKALLQDTHYQEAHVSLARRLAAACVAGLVLLTVWKALLYVFLLAMVVIRQSMGQDATISTQAWLLASVFTSVGLTLSLLTVLYRWQRRLDEGTRLWFLEWSPVSLTMLLTVIVAVAVVFPSVIADFSVTFTPLWTRVITFGGLALAYSFMVIQCAAWLWWCDRPPRNPHTLSTGLLAWVLTVLCASVPIFTVVMKHGDLPSGMTSVARGTLLNGEVRWSLDYAWQSNVFLTLAVSFLFLAAFGYAGRVCYWLLRRFWRKDLESPRLA